MSRFMRSAIGKTPVDQSVILVIGKTGAGKTTTCKSTSNKSHNSSVYTVFSPEGIPHQCFYHEEPSFLANIFTSSALFIEFALFLLSNKGKHIAGIVYVLNIEQESVHQDTHDGRGTPLGFRSHFEFVRSYLGTKCLNSVVLAKNRAAAEPRIMELMNNIDNIWNHVLGSRSLEIREDGNAKDIVQNLVTHSPHLLQLRDEVIRKRKKLQKTEVGRLYINQLNKWINEAKLDRKAIKKANGNLTDIDQVIASLEQDLGTWDKMPYPTKFLSKESSKKR